MDGITTIQPDKSSFERANDRPMQIERNLRELRELTVSYGHHLRCVVTPRLSPGGCCYSLLATPRPSPLTLRASLFAAFSLIEVLLVVIIVGVLAAIVLPNLVGRAEQTRRSAAAAQIANFKTGLNSFELDNGRFPTTTEGLDALVSRPATNSSLWKGPYLEGNVIPKDPWGQGYTYRFPGTVNADGYDLISSGRDGQEGSADDIANFDPSSR